MTQNKSKEISGYLQYVVYLQPCTSCVMSYREKWSKNELKFLASINWRLFNGRFGAIQTRGNTDQMNHCPLSRESPFPHTNRELPSPHTKREAHSYTEKNLRANDVKYVNALPQINGPLADLFKNKRTGRLLEDLR